MGQGQSAPTYHSSAVGSHSKTAAVTAPTHGPQRREPRREVPQKYAPRPDPHRSPPEAIPGHFASLSPAQAASPEHVGSSVEQDPARQPRSPLEYRTPDSELHDYFDPRANPSAGWSGWRPARERAFSLSALSTTAQAGTDVTFTPAPESQATAALRAVHRVSNPPAHPDILEVPEESTDSENEARSTESHGKAPSPRRLSLPLAEALRMGLGRSHSGSSRHEGAEVREESSVPTPLPVSSRPSTRSKRATGEIDRERLLAFWAQEDARQAPVGRDDGSNKRRRRHSWSSSAADTSGEDHQWMALPASALHSTPDRGDNPTNPQSVEAFEDPYDTTTVDLWSGLPTPGQVSMYGTPMVDFDDAPYADAVASAADAQAPRSSADSIRSGSRSGRHHERPPRHLDPDAEHSHFNADAVASGPVPAARTSSSFEATHGAGMGAIVARPSVSAGLQQPVPGLLGHATAQASGGLGSGVLGPHLYLPPPSISRVADPQFASSSSDFEDSDVSQEAQRQAMGGTSRSQAHPRSSAGDSSRSQTQKSPSPVYVSQLDSVLMPSPPSQFATTSDDHTNMTASASEADSIRASIGGRPSISQRIASAPGNPSVVAAPASAANVLRAQRHLSTGTGASSHAYAPSQNSETDAIRRREIELLRAGPSFRRDEQAAQLLQAEEGLRHKAASSAQDASPAASIPRSRASSLFTKIKSRVRKGSDAFLPHSTVSSRKGSIIVTGSGDGEEAGILDSYRVGVSPLSSQPSTLTRNRGRQVSAPPAMSQMFPVAPSNSETRSRLVARQEVSAFPEARRGSRQQPQSQIRRKPVQYPVSSLKKPPSISGSLRSSRSGRSGRSVRSKKSAASLQQAYKAQQSSPKLLQVQDEEDGEAGRSGMEVLTVGSWLKNEGAKGEASKEGLAPYRPELAPQSNTRSRLAKPQQPGWEDIEEEVVVDDATVGGASADTTTVIKAPPSESRERKKRSLGSVLGWPRRSSRSSGPDSADDNIPGKVTPFVAPPLSAEAGSSEGPSDGREIFITSPTIDHDMLPVVLQNIPTPDVGATHASSFSSLAPPPAPRPLPPKRPRRGQNRRTASDSQTGSQSEGGGNGPSPQTSRAPMVGPQSVPSSSPAAPVWDESLPLGSTDERRRQQQGECQGPMVASSPHGTVATLHSSYYGRPDDDGGSRILSEDRNLSPSERYSADVDLQGMRSPLTRNLGLVGRSSTANTRPSAAGEGTPLSRISHDLQAARSRSNSQTVVSPVAESFEHGHPRRSPESPRRPLPHPPFSGRTRGHERIGSTNLTISDGMNSVDSPSARSAGLSGPQREREGSSTASFVKHAGEDELRARIRVPSQAESDLSTASARGQLSAAAAAHGAVTEGTVRRRGAVHRRAASGSAASDRLAATLDTDDTRQASRREAPTVARPTESSSGQTRRPLPTPPTSPMETTAVASPVLSKDIDGLPASATSPPFTGFSQARASWQSADGPWKADVVVATPGKEARGYATPLQSGLPQPRQPTTPLKSLRERSSSEPLQPSFTGRAQTPSDEDASLPKGGVQASLAALKALEEQPTDEVVGSIRSRGTVSRFLGSAQYLPPRHRDTDGGGGSSDRSQRHGRRRSRREGTRYYSTEEGLSTASSRAYRREAQRRRRERSRYQRDSRYDEDDDNYYYGSRMQDMVGTSRAVRGSYRRHGKDVSDMAVVSDAGLLDETGTSGSESEWIEYVPVHRTRARVMGIAARPRIPPSKPKPKSRVERQFASEVLRPFEGVADERNYLHYVTPPRRITQAAAAALQEERQRAASSGRYAAEKRRQRSASTQTASTVLATDGEHRRHGGGGGGEGDLAAAAAAQHDRYRTAASQADWDETVVPAVRKQMELEQQMEVEMAKAAAATAPAARDAAAPTAGIQFPTGGASRSADRDSRQYHEAGADEDDGESHHRHRNRRHRHSSSRQYADEDDGRHRHQPHSSARHSHARRESSPPPTPHRRSKNTSTSTAATASANRPRHSKRGLEKEDILVWQRHSAVAGD